ncbi:hypothetical protein Pan54_47340 [Rubinisphaera italica]|uniref:Uncharacterized protein n=1 Tax=Rubinisphaera italica TaxID=2527969 RepID=A0A5C5XM55_9PLAN|nr:hypothetical protein Pan54_47340 [Rubinisphaera italica]
MQSANVSEIGLSYSTPSFSCQITGTRFGPHFDYIHYNPVKHQLVECPKDWEATSFHRWVKQGVYPDDWGCKNYPPIKISETKNDYGEPL